MNSKNENYMPQKIFAAEFTLAIGCRLNCWYCPQKKLIRRYTELYGKDQLQMSFETFKICLSKVEPGAGICFGGMVEAFHNRECANMIRYAYDLGYKVSLDTTLMGATEEDFEKLKDVQFDHFQLHIPDQAGNSKFVINDEYLRVFQKFNDHFITNGYSCHGEVHEEIKPYLRKDVRVNSGMGNRAGNLEYKDLKTFDHHGKIICGCGEMGQTRNWQPEILPNGTVILCCMDYGMEHILGNLVTQGWDEILSGENYRRFEQGLENEEISPLLCRKCSSALPEDDPRTKYGHLLGFNAIRIARVLGEYKSGGGKNQNTLQNQFSEHGIQIIEALAEAGNICVFGLGKLFQDNYFQSLWYNVIRANIFSDNDDEKWGKEIHGITCIPPEKLQNFENLLVVTYVRDDADIRIQLGKMGITNIINAYEIYDLY